MVCNMNENEEIVRVYPFVGAVEVRRHVVRGADGREIVIEVSDIKTKTLPMVKKFPEDASNVIDRICNNPFEFPRPSNQPPPPTVKAIPMPSWHMEELMKRAEKFIPWSKKTEDTELIKHKENVLNDLGATDLHIQLNGWKRHVYAYKQDGCLLKLVTLNEVKEPHKVDWYVRTGSNGVNERLLSREEIMEGKFGIDGDTRINYE